MEKSRPNLEKLAAQINKSQRPQTLALLLVLALSLEPCGDNGDNRREEAEIGVG